MTKAKLDLTLTVTSLLSILLLTFHLADDTVRARLGSAEAGGSTLVAVPILAIWLYGTLILAGRRSGYIFMLLGSLLGLLIPVVHVVGASGAFHGHLARSGSDFFFVWTLHALGVTALFSLALSITGLLSSRRS